MQKELILNIIYNIIYRKKNFYQNINLLKYYFGKKDTTVKWNPIFISTFITYKCNLYCDMCLTHSTCFDNPNGQMITKDMDMDLFKGIVNKYKFAYSVYIIGNGEPLLNENFFDMINYASNEMKMKVMSSTNGIVINKYIPQIFSSKLDHLNVSINAYNSSDYLRITGMPKKYHDQIIENVKKLILNRSLNNSRLKIAGTFIIDQNNYKNIIDIIKFANNLGLDEIVFFQFLPVPVPNFSKEERCLFIDNIELHKIYKEVMKLPKEILKKVKLPPLLEQDMKKNKYCTTPFNTICIDGDGNVGGCSCQLLNFSNNGKFGDSLDPWNNKYFQELRKKFIDKNEDLFLPCTWCYNNTNFKINDFCNKRY